MINYQLFNHKGEPFEEPDRTRLPPNIFHAAETNDVDELIAALSIGQRLDDRMKPLLNMTPAHVACINHSTEFMLAACKEGSLDPWARDDNDRTAYDHAAAKGNSEVLKALLPLMHPPGSLKASMVISFPRRDI